MAQTQVSCDGACIIYGRNKACSFLRSPDPAGHAFFSVFTTDDISLNTLHTIHLRPNAKSNTINMPSLAIYLYQATRISREADDG